MQSTTDAHTYVCRKTPGALKLKASMQGKLEEEGNGIFKLY